MHGLFVLVSEVTELKRAQLAIKESEQFAKTTIDTVPETICVLDNTCVIIAVNQAWRDFYDANHDDPQFTNYALETNYLQVCESAIGDNATEATRMAQGLAAGLRGERDLFSLEVVREIAPLVSGSEVVVLEQAAHCAYFEQPEAFNRHVLDFLKRKMPARGHESLPG